MAIPKGYPFFRARRNPLGRDFKYINELGMNKTSRGPNRASPSGISYMYLAEDEITAITVKGKTATGYDYGSGYHFSGSVSNRSASIYDYESGQHYNYSY